MMKFSFQDDHDTTATDFVFWLSAFYSVFPLVIMVISYSMICYKVHMSTLNLKMKGTITFNKQKNEVCKN